MDSVTLHRHVTIVDSRYFISEIYNDYIIIYTCKAKTADLIFLYNPLRNYHGDRASAFASCSLKKA